MALLQYTFPELNESAQIGDMVYYIPTTDNSGFTVANGGLGDNVVVMGFINSIVTGVDENGLLEGEVITVPGDIPPNTITFTGTAPFTNVRVVIDTQEIYLMADNEPPPTTVEYIFFQKNNIVNAGSVTGYYAEAKFRNNSTHPAEMFTASCEVTESSK